MCVIFIFTDPDPKENEFRIIIASNRDEGYSRPAKAAYQCETTGIIGGRDMEQGRQNGMWLGASNKSKNELKFRFAALLNVTGEERHSGVEGRGFLVTDYLKNTEILACDYIDNLLRNEVQHNAFNLVTIELSENSVKTFHNSNVPLECTEYEGKNILGFGNSTTKVPLKKVMNGKGKFKDIINKLNNVNDKRQLYEELFQLLKWEKSHLPDPELERRAPSWYEYLSSIYVKMLDANYGTRTHSIVTVDYDWNLDFTESTMEEPIDGNNPTWNTVHIGAKL